MARFFFRLFWKCVTFSKTHQATTPGSHALFHIVFLQFHQPQQQRTGLTTLKITPNGIKSENVKKILPDATLDFLIIGLGTFKVFSKCIMFIFHFVSAVWDDNDCRLWFYSKKTLLNAQFAMKNYNIEKLMTLWEF